MKKMLVFYGCFLTLTILLTGCSKSEKSLQKSLYYLDGSDEISQVWRLERDGVTRKQVTDEPLGVAGFVVSSKGDVAYITDNKLFLMNFKRRNRRLIADGDEVLATGEEAYFNKSVAGLSFSPDGRTLAYGLNGIHLYDVKTHRDEQVLFNLDNLLNEPFVFVKEVYTPGAWSPDGSRLIITMSYYEGSTLAVMQPGVPEAFTRLRSDGAVCCLYSWSADSRYVLVANPWFSGTLPGLWQFDAFTGAQTLFIPGHLGGLELNFIGWPFQTSEGELFYFHSYNTDFIPPEEVLFSLERSDDNLQDPINILSEEFSIRSGLWSLDGSRVLIVGRYDDREMGLFLIIPEKNTIECVLAEGLHIRNLAWGP